ncbi:hypothetical protein AB669_04275 [Pedobacter sp. BMA]|nr:hypothetical protein AB669_04275 [Pedobacter sp. BMA]
MKLVQKKKPTNPTGPTNNEIRGIVTDEKGDPIPNATIKIKGSTLATLADDKGLFKLGELPESGILIATSLGFKEQEFSFSQLNKNELVIVLVESERMLEEVKIVSTGYQNISKERATGSFVQPNRDMLEARVAPDILSKLEGITSGLLFNRNTLSTNAGKNDLSIRGRSTIFANDQPLIVVDNFPFNGDINTINPNDVETITVLKDAAAASIWGVRAGNGVIVITTKRGKVGQDLNISMNANLTTSKMVNPFYNPNYLPSSEYINLETFLFKNGKYDASINDVVNFPVISPVVQILNLQRNGQSSDETERQLKALRSNDYRNEELKYFYRNPLSQQYQLSISGATSKATYYLSTGYDKLRFNIKGNDNDRLTINSQNTFRPIKDLEVQAGIYYVRSNSQTDNTFGAVSSGTNFLPYYNLANADGIPLTFDRDYSSSFKQASIARGFLDWIYIPLNEIGRFPTNTKNNDLRLTTGLQYSILNGLNAEIKYQFQQIDNTGRLLNGIESYQARNLINQYSILTANKVNGYNVPIGGVLNINNGKTISNNIRTQLNFQRDFAKNSISALVGYELSEFTTDAYGNTYYGYNDELGTFGQVNSVTTVNLNPSGTGTINTYSPITARLDRFRSTFGNISYSYNNVYTLSASARIDGSNYFGVKTNQKNVPLWSIGALWNINKEKFYTSSLIPKLVLRTSYGYNGNLDKGNTGITTFRYSPNGALYTNQTYANIVSIGNPELRWEKIGILNIGIDFMLKGNFLSGTIEYYHKKGEDILGDRAFAANTGITTQRGNYSDMVADGLDFAINSQNLKGKFGWTSSLLFSFVKDKVTKYDVIDPNSVNYVGGTFNNKPIIGRPVFGIYSYPSAGLDPANGDPRGYLNSEISKNYSSIINSATIDQLEYDGPARPTVFGGLNNRLTYKNIALSFNISYKLGYYFRRSTVNYFNMYNRGLSMNMNKDFIDRWQKPGDEHITNTPSIAPYNVTALRDQFYQGTNATVEPGDHIRLQDVSLAYTLDKSNWKKIPFAQIQLYVYANNLGILWRKSDYGLDPDVVPTINNRLLNLTPKSISFGIKTNF